MLGPRNIREEFLDMALDVFAKKGVSGTSVASVAAAVGVTPAMAHYYFSGREQLLDAVVQERLFPLIDSVWADFDLALAQGGELVSSIEKLIDNLLLATQKLPSLPSLWLNEVMAESGQFKSRVLPYVLSRYLANFRRAFAAAEARGEIAAGMNPRLVILSILGSTLLPLASTAITDEGDSDAPSRGQIAAHAKRLLVPGLLPALRHDEVPVKHQERAGQTRRKRLLGT